MASEQKIGSYAFLAGAGVAIIAGVLAGAGQTGVLPAVVKDWIPLVLVILGVIVGVLNVKDKEIHEFLVASIVFLLLAGNAAGLNQIPVIGVYLAAIAVQLGVFVAPAAIIVAVKDIKQMAQGT